jgi:hypothetical protein
MGHVMVPFLKTVVVVAPAAGAELNISPRGGEMWRVLSLVFSLATDANVANRGVRLTVDDGTSVHWCAIAPTLQAASLTTRYGVYAGAGREATSADTTTFPLGDGGQWLLGGWRLRTDTNNIQAGDQYTGIVALVEEYHTGPNALYGAQLAVAGHPEEA